MEKHNNKNIDERLKYIVLSLVLAVGCIVFEILCLRGTQIKWLIENRTFFLILSVLITVGSFFLSAFFIVKGLKTATKSVIGGYFFLLLSLTALFVLQKVGFFQIVKDAETFKEYIRKAGAWMPVIYIVFQFLQVVVLPVPSIVSTVAGVAMFGALQAAIYSFIGIMLGSILAFFIGRKLGVRAVNWLVGEDALKKWRKKLKGKDNFILTLMFILPLFPDDVLCFIAGLSTMTTKYFLITITVCRLLAIFTTCYSINFIPLNTPWGVAVWGILIACIIIAFWLIYKNIDGLNKWFSKRLKKRKNHENSCVKMQNDKNKNLEN